MREFELGMGSLPGPLFIGHPITKSAELIERVFWVSRRAKSMFFRLNNLSDLERNQFARPVLSNQVSERNRIECAPDYMRQPLLLNHTPFSILNAG